MLKKALILLFFLLSSCFKRSINQYALLHQKTCIDSIADADYSRAKLHCELCLEYDRSMPECLNGLGLIAMTQKDPEKAREFFTKALRQDNDFSEARNNLGVIYFSGGDFKKAESYFSRALEIDPSNLDARYNLGLSHLRLAQRFLVKETSLARDHLLKARDQIKKLLEIEPNYFSAYRDLGLIDLGLHEVSALRDEQGEHLLNAKEAFSLCLKNNNQEDGCYEGLAEVNIHEGDFSQAFANYFSCLAYAPANSACKSGIILTYEKSVQAENGFKEMSHIVKNDQQNASAHMAFGFALFEKGLDQEALKQCEHALRIKPDLCPVQFRLAEYYTSIASPKAVKYCQSFLVCGQNQSIKEINKCQEILARLKR